MAVAERAGRQWGIVSLAQLRALGVSRRAVDLYWPAHRLIVETDGWDTHRTRQAFERDRARDAALAAAGHRVVRFTWRTPDTTIERRLRALLHD